MKKSVLWSLTEKDRALLMETRPKDLDELDEDGLVALHTRVQRTRTKHVKNYRRSAADRVTSTGTRGGARPGNQAHRDRAEAFEDALARVSRRLAKVARQSANALRDERIAAARKTGGASKAAERKPAGRPADRLNDRRDTSPARQKRVASTTAVGARRQARKDNR